MFNDHPEGPQVPFDYDAVFASMTAGAQPPPPQERFGWPRAITLIMLTALTFTFSIVLFRLDVPTWIPVVLPLMLLAGTTMVVLPAAGAALWMRASGAARGMRTGWGGRR